MLLIDSASPSDVEAAFADGLVTGVTMNPTLVSAQAPAAPLDVLRDVLKVSVGSVFYQPTVSAAVDAAAEVESALDLAGERLVVKLAANTAHVRLARQLTDRGVPVALTAVYAPAQALVASSVGAGWVIPYVDRARRLMPSPPGVVSALASVLRGRVGAPLILAASVKSPEQAVEAVRDGADALTIPLAVLRSLVGHPLTDAAVEEFDAATARARAATAAAD